MILLVSNPGDDHGAAVLAKIRDLGADATLLDLAEFPQQMSIAFSYSDGAADYRLRHSGGAFAASELDAIWWRRPGNFVPHAEITKPSLQNFVYSESHEAFAGFWQAVDAAWINDPINDEAAAHKVYQLRLAQQVGMQIPRTLISNDVDAVRSFIVEVGEQRIVYKSFTATEQEWRETRLLKVEEQALLDNVRYAPVIFQEYIEADVDVRITFVGGEMFAAAIHSQESSYKVDFRVDWTETRVEPVELPDPVAAQLSEFMRRIGLVYGAIDMRRTPDGRYVFLEVNPSGQWLFIEARTGQPITDSLARKLIAAGASDR